MNEKNNTLTTPEGHKLTFYERESVEINLNLAKDTLELLEEIAKKKDLSVISVIKFLISKGIRDLEPELAKKSAIKRFKNRKNVEEKLEVDLAA
jgi:hypothetical protein